MNLKPLAKTLRVQATDAERLLWYHLRAQRMSGFKFRRQVAIEPYIVDFVCLEAKVIIEADGGQHTEQAGHDKQRTTCLESMGYRVLRFWNHEILADTQTVLEKIYAELIKSRQK